MRYSARTVDLVLPASEVSPTLGDAFPTHVCRTMQDVDHAPPSPDPLAGRSGAVPSPRVPMVSAVDISAGCRDCRHHRPARADIPGGSLSRLRLARRLPRRRCGRLQKKRNRMQVGHDRSRTDGREHGAAPHARRARPKRLGTWRQVSAPSGPVLDATVAELAAWRRRRRLDAPSGEPAAPTRWRPMWGASAGQSPWRRARMRPRRH